MLKRCLCGLLSLVVLLGVAWLRLQATTTLTLNTRPFSAQTLFAGHPEGWSRLAELLPRLGSEFCYTQFLPDLLFCSLALYLAAQALPRLRVSSWPLFGVGLALVIGVQFLVLHRFPISGDETSYLAQAKLLRHGQLKGSSWGELDAHFQAPSLIRKDGVRSKYQIGWPAWLALGGFLANPLLGAGCLGLIYRLARVLELPAPAAPLAAASLGFSTFFVFNCASWGIHPTCLFLTLLFLWGWIRQSKLSLLLSCLSVFWLANVRLVELPLVAAAACLWPPRRRLAWVGLISSLLMGLAIVAQVNQVQNGDPWLLGFQVYDPEDRWGFGVRGHDLPRAFWNQSYSLARYLAWMPAGWLVLLVFGIRAGATGRLALASLVGWGIYACHYNLGVVEYGPRYWFVPGLLLCLCAARGAVELSQILQRRWPSANWLGGLLAISLVECLLQLCTVGQTCYSQVESVRAQYERLSQYLSQGPPTLVFLQAGGGSPCGEWVRFDSPELSDYTLFAYFLDPPSNQRLVQRLSAMEPLVLTQELDSSGRLSGQFKAYSPGDSDPMQWVRGGENYLSELQDQRQAARCFERALELDAKNLYAHSYLEQIESGRGAWLKALEHGRLVAKLAPENLKAHYLLGLDLQHAGLLAEARREMALVAQSSAPESDQARQWLKQNSDGH